MASSARVIKKILEEEASKQQLEKEKAKKHLEEQRRKTVFAAIESLADTVDEDKLLSVLDILDTNSWKEVVEERFIGRLCGWPLCDNDITVKRTQQYKLDQNKKKVYENFTDREKFCSTICYQKSEHLQEQLAELPLWIMGERQSKQYDLNPSQNSSFQQPKTSNTDKKEENENKIEYVPDKLIVQLADLHLGQVAASDSENEDHDDDQEKTDKAAMDLDNKLFLSSIHSLVSTKNTSSSSPSVNTRNSKEKTGSSPSQMKMDKETMEQKLEKLRSKYGKNSKENQKKAPIIVEPHRMEKKEAAKVCKE